MVTTTSNNIATNTWVKATWEEFLVCANSNKDKAEILYYDQGYLRIEMASLGSAHCQDNSIISTVIVLYCALKNIRIKEFTNGSFYQPGVRECQPDLAFYLGNDFVFPPHNNSPVDINQQGAPNLVVEIGSSSFADDLGRKRLLYEQLGVAEYWVVNVTEGEIIAFAIADGGSRTIKQSQVLPGLAISLVEEALSKSKNEDDGAITRWLIGCWS